MSHGHVEKEQCGIRRNQDQRCERLIDRPSKCAWNWIYAAALGALISTSTRAPAQSPPNVVAWGSFYISGAPPVAPPDGATNIAAASAGVASAIALRLDGTFVGWGADNTGQTNVPAGLTNVIGVAADQLSLALRSNGSVAAWGQTGTGVVSLTEVAGLTNVVAVSSQGTCLALRSDRTIVAWGGYRTLTNVPQDLTNIVAIAAGGHHCLVLRADGTVGAWGDNFTTSTNVPPGLSNVVSIAAGWDSSLALKADGTLVGWGGGTLSSVTNYPPGLTNVAAIGAGYEHWLALRSDGTVVAWGDDSYGQTDVPPGLTNVTSISAGYVCSMAVVGAPTLPALVQVTNMAFGGGAFTAEIPTERGRLYSFEYKNSLSDAQWTLLPLLAGTGDTVQLRDSSATSGQRFYRVRRWVSMTGLR